MMQYAVMPLAKMCVLLFRLLCDGLMCEKSSFGRLLHPDNAMQCT